LKPGAGNARWVDDENPAGDVRLAVKGSFRDSPIYIAGVSVLALVLLGLTVAPHIHLPKSQPAAPTFYTFAAPPKCPLIGAYAQSTAPGSEYSSRAAASRAAARFNRLLPASQKQCRAIVMTFDRYESEIRMAPVPGQGPYVPPGSRSPGFGR
jgi:hypothetical protein